MDSNVQRDEPSKDDSDSGLDNTSDSYQSGDEDHQGVLTDYDDLLHSDGEGNFHLKDVKNGSKSAGVNFNVPAIPKKSLTPCCHEVDIQIESSTSTSVKEDYKEALEFYQALMKSQEETVDFSITNNAKKPEWLDEEKFKRGQKFARDHFFCINFAETLSLFILFSQKSSLKPLIFTGKSDSPFTSFTRYLNTVTKLMSWYQDDVWAESESAGKKNLSVVRAMHKDVYKKLTKSSSEDLEQMTTLGDPNSTALWCPLRDLLVDDFNETLPRSYEDTEWRFSEKKVWINQADMSITQFGFVGLAVTYPEHFGIHLASEDDLEAFLHMWRGLGYLLGIKDSYNYCNGDLETVRKRTRFYLEAMAKPAFREVTYDWEHMCRCLVGGISFYLPQVNFESSFLYLCHVLQINTPRLKKEVSFWNHLLFQLQRLVFYLMKFQGVLPWLNTRLNGIIKKTQNASPEVLNKWKNKEFPYMSQKGKCPIRGQFTSQNL